MSNTSHVVTAATAPSRPRAPTRRSAWDTGAGACHTVMYGRGPTRHAVLSFCSSDSEADFLRARIVVLAMRIAELGGEIPGASS